MPSQEEVNKFFSDTQNEMHYLNSKPVAGQKGTLNKSEVEPWDEYDLSNWKSLNRKAKLNEYSDENFDSLEDAIANSEFSMDYDQLGSGEKEWVRDEIDNMSMNEDLNEAIYTDPNTGKSYDLQHDSSKNRWELDIIKKDSSIYDKIVTIKRKTVEEIIDWLEGYNIDSSWVKKIIKRR